MITEDRYEIIQDDEIIQLENYVPSPFLTWYTVDESRGRILRGAGAC